MKGADVKSTCIIINIATLSEVRKFTAQAQRFWRVWTANRKKLFSIRSLQKENIVAKIIILVLVLVFGFSKTSFADSANPKVQLQTNHGVIVLELDAGAAPKTVANFVSYVEAGFYDGTIFHRIIPGFMIQGGGFTPEMTQKKTNAAIQNEADNGLKNARGAIAMARTGDPHSATAQFFINTVDNTFLNYKAKTAQGWGYCVFGNVTEGLEIVDAIEAVKTTTKAPHENVPVEAVIIEKATLLEE